MAPVKCSYFKCPNTTQNKSMFRFPWNKSILQKWITNCGNPKISKLTISVLRNRYLCTDHFEAKNVSNVKGNRRRLINDAVPIPCRSPESENITPTRSNVEKQDNEMITDLPTHVLRKKCTKYDILQTKAERMYILPTASNIGKPIKKSPQLIDEQLKKRIKESYTKYGENKNVQRKRLIKIAIPKMDQTSETNISSLEKHEKSQDDETIIVLPIDELRKKCFDKSDVSVKKGNGQTTIVIKIDIHHPNKIPENNTNTELNTEKTQDDTNSDLNYVSQNNCKATNTSNSETGIVIKTTVHQTNNSHIKPKIEKTQDNKTISNLHIDDFDYSHIKCEQREILQTGIPQPNQGPEIINFLSTQADSKTPQVNGTIRIVSVEELMKKRIDSECVNENENNNQNIKKIIKNDSKLNQALESTNISTILNMEKPQGEISNLTERRGSLAALESEARRGSGVAGAGSSRAPSDRLRASPPTTPPPPPPLPPPPAVADPLAPPPVRTYSRRGLSVMNYKSSNESPKHDFFSPYPMYPKCSGMYKVFPPKVQGKGYTG